MVPITESDSQNGYYLQIESFCSLWDTYTYLLFSTGIYVNQTCQYVFNYWYIDLNNDNLIGINEAVYGARQSLQTSNIKAAQINCFICTQSHYGL